MISHTLPTLSSCNIPDVNSAPGRVQGLQAGGLEPGLITELRWDPMPQGEVSSLREARHRLRELRRNRVEAERQLASTRRRRTLTRQIRKVHRIVTTAHDGELADLVIRRNRMLVLRERVQRERLRAVQRALDDLARQLTPRVLLDMAQAEWRRLQDSPCPDQTSRLCRLFSQNHVVVRLESILRRLHPPEAGLLALPWIQQQLTDLMRLGKLNLPKETPTTDSDRPIF